MFVLFCFSGWATFTFKRWSLTLWLHGSKLSVVRESGAALSHHGVGIFVGTCAEQVDVLGSWRVNQKPPLQLSLAPLERRLLLKKVRANHSTLEHPWRSGRLCLHREACVLVMSETSGTTAPQHYLGARYCGDLDIGTTSKWSHVSSCGLCCLLFLTFNLYDFSSLHLQTPFHSCSVVRRAGSSDLHGLPLIEVKLEVISNHSWWRQVSQRYAVLWKSKREQWFHRTGINILLGFL